MVILVENKDSDCHFDCHYWSQSVLSNLKTIDIYMDEYDYTSDYDVFATWNILIIDMSSIER
ncbi:hypothetical protein KSD_57020 [Ktedonobacter sp. SOSP1-85]|nr:hypothetical protein KSD_57020 [Ktedonobacter sp. SOSP1-85]